MARKNPPSDTDTPEENTEANVAAGDEPIDAEIVSETEHDDVAAGSETSAAEANDAEESVDDAATAALDAADEVVDDAQSADDQADAVANDDEPVTSGSLATPFAIILGALAVIALLIFVLNRGNDDPQIATNGESLLLPAPTGDDDDSASTTIAINPVGTADNAATDRAEASANDAVAQATDSTDGLSVNDETVTAHTAEVMDGSNSALLAMARERAQNGRDTAATADDVVEGAEDAVAAATDQVDAATDVIASAAETVEENVAGAATAIEGTTDDILDTAEAALNDVVGSGESAQETVADAASTAASIIDQAVSNAPAVTQAVSDDSAVADVNAETGTDTAIDTEIATTAYLDALDADSDTVSTDGVEDTATVVEETVAAVVADEEVATIAEETVAVVAVEDTTQAAAVAIDTPATPSADTPDATEDDLEEAAEAIAERMSSLRDDVLAETSQVIETRLEVTEQALEETGREVAAIRSELQDQRAEANERLASISERLETIQSTDLSDTRQSTLLLALSDLSDSLESGEPFVRELETVEQIAPSVRQLSVLHSVANDGLPTNADMLSRYQETARRALSDTRREGAEGSGGRFWANMSGLFSVRDIGEVEGDTPSAIIARGEVHLENNDLAGTLNELRALDGVARDAFSDWIDAAEAKLDARRRLEIVEQQVASRAG